MSGTQADQTDAIRVGYRVLFGVGNGESSIGHVFRVSVKSRSTTVSIRESHSGKVFVRTPATLTVLSKEGNE